MEAAPAPCLLPTCALLCLVLPASHLRPAPLPNPHKATCPNPHKASCAHGVRRCKGRPGSEYVLRAQAPEESPFGCCTNPYCSRNAIVQDLGIIEIEAVSCNHCTHSGRHGMLLGSQARALA